VRDLQRVQVGGLKLRSRGALRVGSLSLGTRARDRNRDCNDHSVLHHHRTDSLLVVSNDDRELAL